MVARDEKVENVVSRRVEVKGHKERVEKVKPVVTDFDQSVQETLKVTTVDLDEGKGWSHDRSCDTNRCGLTYQLLFASPECTVANEP